MKKTAIAVAGILSVMGMLAGCGGKDTEEMKSAQIQEETTKTDSMTEQMEEITSSEDDTVSESVEVSDQSASVKDIEKAQKEMKEAARKLLLEEEKKMIDTEIPLYEGAHIAVVSKSTDGEYWNLVKQGMEDAIAAVNEAYGFEKDQQVTMNFEGAESELDVETQVNTIDAVIAENPDVLCISAGDMDSCMAQLEAARENGIPVVAFDSNVSESEMITAYRATDNLEVGRIAAGKFAEQLGETGALAVFSAPEMTESGRNRLQGFKKELENYPEMELVEIVYMDQVEDMRSAMQSTIVEHPELRGIFCTNASVAEIYLEMQETFESRSILMIGVDATTVQQEAIHSGNQLGIISQNPHMMGFETIWTALLTSVQEDTGVEFMKNKLLQPAWIDLNNIDDEEFGKYLY